MDGGEEAATLGLQLALAGVERIETTAVSQ
jgi:hypothetical protein